MPKISGYPENAAPDPEMFILVEPDTQDGKYKSPLGNLSVLPYRNKMQACYTDFYGSEETQLLPFSITAISTGTIAAVANEANHPGIWRITSSAAGSTGYAVTLTGLTSVLIDGTETCEFVIRINTLANTVARFGLIDSVSTGAPADCVQLVLSGSVFTGTVLTNSVGANTSTTYSPAAATWYRLLIEVNAAASLSTFSIYNASGTLLWTDTVTGNIPTTAGRETSFGMLAYRTAITATSLIDIDFMSFVKTKALTR